MTSVGSDPLNGILPAQLNSHSLWSDQSAFESAMRIWDDGDLVHQPHLPAEFIDCITQEVMQDPVITADGHSYERSAILRWLQFRLSLFCIFLTIFCVGKCCNVETFRLIIFSSYVMMLWPEVTVKLISCSCSAGLMTQALSLVKCCHLYPVLMELLSTKLFDPIIFFVVKSSSIVRI
jgi:hypothetical protein